MVSRLKLRLRPQPNDAGDGGEEFDPDAWQRLTDHLSSTYSSGAEGICESGDIVYYGFSDDSDMVLLAVISADGTAYSGREGVLEEEDDHYVLVSEEMGDGTSLVFGEQDADGNFTITFLGDGDVATMRIVDQETFLNDFLAAYREFV